MPIDTSNPLVSRAVEILQGNDTGVSTKPAPALYPHLWSWDSAFIAIGIAQYSVDRAVEEMREFAGIPGIPVYPTWNALDIGTSDFRYYGGRIGTHGGAGRNFGIQQLGSSVGGRQPHFRTHHRRQHPLFRASREEIRCRC